MCEKKKAWHDFFVVFFVFFATLVIFLEFLFTKTDLTLVVFFVVNRKWVVNRNWMVNRTVDGCWIICAVFVILLQKVFISNHVVDLTICGHRHLRFRRISRISQANTCPHHQKGSQYHQKLHIVAKLTVVHSARSWRRLVWLWVGWNSLYIYATRWLLVEVTFLKHQQRLLHVHRDCAFILFYYFFKDSLEFGDLPVATQTYVFKRPSCVSSSSLPVSALVFTFFFSSSSTHLDVLEQPNVTIGGGHFNAKRNTPLMSSISSVTRLYTINMGKGRLVRVYLRQNKVNLDEHDLWEE